MDTIRKLDSIERVDTRLISTFVTLARSGSFTAAGAELHLAQSTVTAHVQALERELGVRLFDRLPAGAVLTEAGRRTWELANGVLDAEATLRADALADGPITGTVVVGATESLCAYLLPHVIAALHRNHPKVDVQLMPVGTAEGRSRLRTGRLTLAVMIEPSVNDQDLVVEPLGVLDLSFVSARDHPVARTRTTWHDLVAHRWFLLEEGCTYSDGVAREFHAMTGARPMLTRLGSVEATRACVAEGLGLTLLPTFAVDGHEDRLAYFDGPATPRQSILLAHHRRRSLGRAAHAVADELAKGAAALTSR
jgi:DNA-binding transcriptional LysR family regulator